MVLGAITGLLILWLFLMKPLLALTIPTDNLGAVIAGAAVFPIIYSFLSIIIGAILGLTVYNIVIQIREKKDNKSKIS